MPPGPEPIRPSRNLSATNRWSRVVLRFVNDAHATATKPLDDVVVGDGLAYQGIGAIVADCRSDRWTNDSAATSIAVRSRKPLRFRFRAQERAEPVVPAPHHLRRPAGETCRALAWTLQRGLKQIIELFPLIQIHR